MKRLGVPLVLATVVGIVVLPAPARADAFVAPWLGVDTGGRSASSVVGVGADAGSTIAGVIGVDFDFGYSPDFFGDGVNSHVVTAMGNVTVGIPFGDPGAPRVRPYLTAGVGLIRSSIETSFSRGAVTSNDFGVNVGGGVMGFFASHVGVRADLRYVRSAEDEVSRNSFGAIDFGPVRYWRTSFGLVLR